MGAHTDSSPVSRLEVIEVGRRRRWTDAEKLRIVAESMAGRRRVSATARRHGISRSQLNKWRALARDGRLVGGADAIEDRATQFAPVMLTADPPATPQPSGVADRIEIVLPNGRRILVSETVDAAALARIISAAEQA